MPEASRDRPESQNERYKEFPPKPPTMNDNWDGISYIISSQYRVAVLRRLSESPATPSRIANDSDLGIAHVSRALQGLRERDLVELLVSEERRKGRVYGITEEGQQAWETIESEGMVEAIE